MGVTSLIAEARRSLAGSPRRRLGTDPYRRRYSDVRELIASRVNPTPLTRLNRVVPAGLEAYLKLEWMNPFGSVKDRTARYLLDGMRERGELEGRELVEATSGNTGIALARAIAESPAHRGRYAMPNQYGNPDNVRAHYETTGPEIWEQTEGRVRTFVAGYGTCGTITGVARFLKERDRGIRVVAVEPQQGHRLPGLKNLEEAKAPEILDRSVIDDVVRVDDEPAYAMTLRLFREEGLIVGPSSGAIAHAIAGLDARASGLVVGISPDSGQKYGSFFADVLEKEGAES